MFLSDLIKCNRFGELLLISFANLFSSDRIRIVIEMTYFIVMSFNDPLHLHIHESFFSLFLHFATVN